MRTAALCVIIFALFLLPTPHASAASLIGQDCTGSFGTTKLDTNRVNLIACLHTSETVAALVWKGMTEVSEQWKGYPKNHPKIGVTTSSARAPGGGFLGCVAYTDAQGAPYLAVGSSGIDDINSFSGFTVREFGIEEFGTVTYSACMVSPNGLSASLIDLPYGAPYNTNKSSVFIPW
jgi:hypothetical protein